MYLLEDESLETYAKTAFRVWHGIRYFAFTLDPGYFHYSVSDFCICNT